MDYLVSPPEATEWSLEPDAFAAALRERWPGAEVREVPASDPTYAIDFAVSEPDRVDGSFARDGQALGLNGDLEGAMRVAAWFRSLVPDEQALLFYDPALNGQVELEPGTAPEQAAAAYLEDAA
jgi:hypothetical protein